MCIDGIMGLSLAAYVDAMFIHTSSTSCLVLLFLPFYLLLVDALAAPLVLWIAFFTKLLTSPPARDSVWADNNERRRATGDQRGIDHGGTRTPQQAARLGCPEPIPPGLSLSVVIIIVLIIRTACSRSRLGLGSGLRLRQTEERRRDECRSN